MAKIQCPKCSGRMKDIMTKNYWVSEQAKVGVSKEFALKKWVGIEKYMKNQFYKCSKCNEVFERQ